MKSSFREIAGGQMMIGIPGTRVTPAVRKLVRAIRPGGVIFFRPNFGSVKAFLKLQRDLEKAAGRELLFAVDHEGGRVIHLAAGITVFPDNQTLGNTRREEFARAQGRIEARELRRLGIHLNLAPTLDVLGKNDSPNIGIRSYGRDPDLVSRLGAARIRGMQESGVSACAKHFPGQGQSPKDAHLDLPVLESSRKEMDRIHLQPFRAAVRAGVASFMSSHPVYPRLDKIRRPATFSRPVITDMLRGELGFKGAILSDDLEMGALNGICRIGESACRAVEAGHDMVLVCHDGKKQMEVFEALVRAYEKGRLDPWELEKSLVRIEDLRRKIPAGKKVSARGVPEKIAAAGVLKSGKHAKPAFEKGDKVSVIFPALTELAARIFIEPAMMDEKKYAAAVLKEAGLKMDGFQKTGLKILPAESARAKKLEGNRIFFCYDASQDAGARSLLKDLAHRPGKLAVVLLRDPYSIRWVPGSAVCVTAFGFRRCQIAAAVKLLVKS